MKYIWILGLLTIWLVACNPKPDEYYFKRIQVGALTIDTTKVAIEKEVKGNQVQLTYKTALDTTIYLIDRQDKKKSKRIPASYPEDTFYLVKEHPVSIGSKKFIVSHFSTYDGTMDGGSEHFWHEELGMFYSRGRTWPILLVLESTNEEKNKLVWSLIHKVDSTVKDRLEYIESLEKRGMVIKWN